MKTPLLFIEKEKVEEIQALKNIYPNDSQLGSVIRFKFNDEAFVRQTPNDQELGSKIRKILNSF